MGEHDALGVGGSAGGVEQRGQIALSRYEGLEASGAGGEDGIEIRGEALGNSQGLGAPLIAFCAMSGSRRGYVSRGLLRRR